MKAAVAPEKNAVCETRDLDKPETRAGEVLVNMLASGICYTDVWTTTGVVPRDSSPGGLRARGGR